jgi:hypothetical protein
VEAMMKQILRWSVVSIVFWTLIAVIFALPQIGQSSRWIVPT